MWRLRSLLFLVCMSLSHVSRAAGVIHVSGYEGGDVGVPCPYGHGYESYEKYLCKNDCGGSDVLITTSETKKNRYSIYDDKKAQLFTVTISDLRSMDAGKYWCGVTRTGADIYTEVKLEVGQDSCCSNVVKILNYEEGSVSISCPYKSEDQGNLKYMCRGNQPSTCLWQAVITSNNKLNGRFTLTDDRVSRKFTVVITSLTSKDSGPYLCGVYRNTRLDVFSAVELEVKKWCCVQSNNVKGIVGRPVTLQCPYPPQHRDNRKFLCKGDHRNNCTDMVTKKSRFTLQDDVSSSTFLVTVTELEAGDAGTYWCGSDSQWGVGNYTKIQLSAVFLQPTSPVTSTITVETVGTNSTHTSGQDTLLSVVLSVVAVLLILILALVVVYKKKCYKVQEDGRITSRNKPKAAAAAEVVTGAGDIYSNQQVVMKAKQRTSKQHSARQSYDDADEPDYENFTITEEIYCNQNYHKVNKR